MMFYNDAVDHMQNYCVTRDRASLTATIALLQKELDDPSLQAAVVRVPEKAAEFEEIMTREKSYCLEPTGVDFIRIEDGPVVKDRYLRVLASDQEEGTALMVRVAHADDRVIVLVGL